MHLSDLGIFSAITVSSVLTAGERLQPGGCRVAGILLLPGCPGWLEWLLTVMSLFLNLEAKRSLSCLDLGERGTEKPSGQGCGCWMCLQRGGHHSWGGGHVIQWDLEWQRRGKGRAAGEGAVWREESGPHCDGCCLCLLWS